ncbi:MAG: autotransporter-associated beta strand repeat-containing protein [Spartobacteria bacterium]
MATNWTPATVPNGPTDIATFGNSSTTNVSLSTNTQVDRVVFSAAASAFNIATPHAIIFTVSGAGIVNNSGATQGFAVTPDPANPLGDLARMVFTGNAAVGAAVELTTSGGVNGGGGSLVEFRDQSTPGNALITNNGGIQNSAAGQTQFLDNSTAASATIENKAVTDGGFSAGGLTAFFGSSSAGNASITNRALNGQNGAPGVTTFAENASADHANIVCEGADNILGFGGAVDFLDNATAGNAQITLLAVSSRTSAAVKFLDNSSAGNATIIANGASGNGGIITFAGGDGGTARFVINRDAVLDASFPDDDGVNLGSVEGSGALFLGSNEIRIGTNNLSTAFNGTAADKVTGTHGSITKVGTGTLELRGDNLYSGNTTVENGTLRVSNRKGSGTGTSVVEINAGNLAGSGTIAGATTVGAGNGTRATLAPSAGVRQPARLTIQSMLTFKSDGSYTFMLNARRAAADMVVANGVTLESGAQFTLRAVALKRLPEGTSFTAISNTSAEPINGTFANLPDGSTLVVGRNTFEASYCGGDGNDLTLTVVP